MSFLREMTIWNWLFLLLSLGLAVRCMQLALRQFTDETTRPIQILGFAIAKELMVIVAVLMLGITIIALSAKAQLPIIAQGFLALPALNRLLIGGLTILDLVLVFMAGWQVRASKFPSTAHMRLRTSLIVGFIASAFAASLITTVGLIDITYRWSWTILIAIGCVALPMLMITTVGTYVSLGVNTQMVQFASTRLKRYSDDKR
jgi:hypothetical protein